MQKRLLFFLGLILLCSCFKKTIDTPSKPTVLVTIAPYKDFIEKIAGSTVEVKTLIPQGVNIHIYEPTPQDVAQRIKAAVWFRIDEPIEKKILQSFKESNPKLIAVNLQKGLNLLSSDDAIELTPCMGHDHGSYDLHTWMSIANVIDQCQTIARSLSQLLPEHITLYKKNLKALVTELQALDQEIQSKLAPFKGQALLVSHPSFAYFCRDYGLLQLSVECEGKEPKPKDLEQILSLASQYTTRCAFLQKGFDKRGAVLIAKKMNLPMYTIDPYEQNYFTMMQQLAEDIAK